jgi:signal transduction histidine kinase
MPPGPHYAADLEQALDIERHRLSREVHDCLSQTLYAIAVSAGTARELLEKDLATAAAGPLENISWLAEDAIAEMRSLILRLWPESLQEHGLVEALRALAHTMHARHGLVVQAHLGPEPDTAAEVGQALYRIAREALFNAARHAKAERVRIRMTGAHDQVVLVVEDDGTGFDASHRFPGHLGLHSMHELAGEAGGVLEIDSRPGDGTRVRACFPARAAGHAA